MINRCRLEKGKRFLKLSVQHLTAVTAAACLMMIFCGSYFEIGSQNTSIEIIYPWEEGMPFEDSGVFESHMRSGINDIVRMAVIRDQMESDGTYDGRKKVDIAAFVSRKTSYSDDNGVSAKYYLEDLIKWQEYGFSYTYITVEPEEKNDYFEEYQYKKFLENADSSMRFYKEAVYTEQGENVSVEAGAETALPDTQLRVEVQPGNQDIVREAVTEQSTEEHSILDERYTTADGRSILDYVSTWEEYDEFVSILRTACEQLAYNYKEYKSFDEYYGAGATNFRYCVEMPSSDGVKYFTNDGAVRELRDDGELTAHFSAYGKYIFYYPEHLQYESNTQISEETVRDYVSRYSYAYTEDSRIWIAVDTSYPVQDGLSDNRLQYDDIMPAYGWLIAAVFVCVLLYVILFIGLTLSEGGEEKEKILKSADFIPAEVMVFLAGIAGLLVVYASMLIGSMLMAGAFRQVWLPAACGVTALFANVTGMFFYLGLVRRLKAHVFWKHTLIVRFLSWNFKWMKKGWRACRRFLNRLYKNRSVAVRTWVPYTGFLVMNLACVMLTLNLENLAGIVIMVLLDLAVGIFQYRVNQTKQKIVDGIHQIEEGDLGFQIDTAKLYGDNYTLADAVNSIGKGIRTAVETSMKDERLKADLITNVSHDIKTPLTSIINYVDLIKREEIQDEKIKGYVEVLDAKSQRLKQLTEDLVEASKISSGNIVYNLETINFVELIHQTMGEFSEKFEEKQLTVITKLPETPVLIEADSRRIWRIVENLYNNLYKYALQGTRVYMDMEVRGDENGAKSAALSIKNISAQPLNINADELTERFIRGDVSRSTEGSGLGLSIAKNLTEAQKGHFTIYLDGDLFKVILEFPLKELAGAIAQSQKF